MAEESGVDILIPYHAQYAHVRNLVLSIIQHTLVDSFSSYRITLVDDFSKNINFFDEISKYDYLDAIRLSEHRGFGAAVNAGITHTKKPYIALLNSDCLIKEANWLIELWNAYLRLSKSDNVRLVSSCMNNAVNGSKLQQQDCVGRDTKDRIVSSPLSLVCCFFPRKLIDRIGYFKEYSFGYYEDEEFFFRMKKFGYKQAVTGKSWVYHEGGLTTNYLWNKNPEIKKVMLEDNRNKCMIDVRRLV